MPDTFQCTLVTPEEQVLDDKVIYASIPAFDGLVGLAPQRAPLVLQLGDGPLRLDYPEGGSRWFFVGGGFAQMKDNRLTLLTAEAVAAEDIVRSEQVAAIKEAQALVATTDEAAARRDRDRERARTLIELAERPVREGV